MKNNIILLLLLLLGWQCAYTQTDNPVADPQAIVTSGPARFTVLSDRLLRIEYAPGGQFTDNASLTIVNRRLPVPAYKTAHANGWLKITTAVLQLEYKENSGPFTAANLHITYHDNNRDITWKPGMKDTRNLKGTTRTLDGAMGKFSFMSAHKLKLDDGILSRSGWTVIDDSERPLFDHSSWPWVEERKNGDSTDWYFFGYGNNYKQAMYDFVSISGKISLPPPFAFGVWYSRFWKYTEQDMKDIVTGYEKHDLPLDVLVVDMDWHLTQSSSPDVFNRYTPKPNGWTGFTWEKKYFPDYKEFLAWTNNKHIQTCLNLHPAAGVQPHEAAYAAFAKAMGVDTAGHPTIPFDITNKKFATNYFDVLLHPYEKDGVDFWWLDWQQWGKTNIKGVNPTFYLNYVHYSDMQMQGKRPLIFHRYGGLGNQRYQIGFSGDYVICWKSLAYQPEFTANAANVGFGYWSHDIGGHFNPISKHNKQDPELFTRWVQWGSFSPIFRTHATADPEIERRIYRYPEPYFTAMQKSIKLRYSLLPYIYTYARMAYDSGISLIRPMYYELPDMDKAYQLNSQYFFGNDMIVAPVCHSMKGNETAEQSVWLPDGYWYDFRNNKQVMGGQTIKARYALDEIPIYVRAGSIIPSQTGKLRIEGSVLDTLILTVYPAQQAKFSLYEDEGNNENYKQGVYSYTHITYLQQNGTCSLAIEPDGKTFTGQVSERCYRLCVVALAKPATVKINGHTATEGQEWSYNPATATATITTARQKMGSRFVIEIK